MLTELEEGNPSATSFFKFQAFTTAVVQDTRIRRRMQAALAGNLRRGEGEKDFRKVIDSEFDRAGLTRLSDHQVNNIYETNVSLAFGAGQMQKMLEVADDFPYWKYSATLDSKTRPTHAALHGKIFRTGDFTFFPPIGFRCRCSAIPLTAKQAGRYLKSDIPDAKERKELYSLLESKEFAGDKQRKFMEWIEQQYKAADVHARKLIDQAFEVMKEEIRSLAYESAKEFFQDEYIKKVEKEFQDNRRVLETAEKAGMTKAEVFRVFAYTDADNKLSADMARLHYGGVLEVWSKNKLLTFKKDLAKAVDKLPKVEGVVYRNLDNIPEDVIKQWTTKGNVITWDGFSSATKSPDVHNARRVAIRITVKNARDIEQISKFPYEKEALLLPGTRLKVIKTEISGNQIIITMKEI